MKGIKLIPDGELLPEVKEKLNKINLNRDKRLEEMRRKYLNGDYDEMFRDMPS